MGCAHDFFDVVTGFGEGRDAVVFFDVARSCVIGREGEADELVGVVFGLWLNDFFEFFQVASQGWDGVVGVVDVAAVAVDGPGFIGELGDTVGYT